MRRYLFALIAGWALSSQAAPLVRDLTLAFDEFYARTADQPMAARVADFRRTIGTQFPQFYGDERGEWTSAEQDKRIATAITRYPAIRATYLKKARDFGAALPRHVNAFQQRFPDFTLPGDVWFIHSLGEMDGGMRDLEGKSYLIFGADGMARYHGADEDEAPFFHHELFHAYHQPPFRDCGDNVTWSVLWAEGLATYVAQVMHPQATGSELLLDFPAGVVKRTEAQLPAAWTQLESVLDIKDKAVHASLFQIGGDGTVLPARRGYYLGYLVAREAGRTHDLHTLAKYGCEEAHTLVAATVRKLKEESAGGAAGK